MYILFTVHVVFVGRLVCSVNVLYMELSYTGSLDRSTRASEHVTVQISYAVRLRLKCIFSLLCMWSLLVDWFVL